MDSRDLHIHESLASRKKVVARVASSILVCPYKDKLKRLSLLCARTHLFLWILSRTIQLMLWILGPTCSELIWRFVGSDLAHKAVLYVVIRSSEWQCLSLASNTTTMSEIAATAKRKTFQTNMAVLHYSEPASDTKIAEGTYIVLGLGLGHHAKSM